MTLKHQPPNTTLEPAAAALPRSTVPWRYILVASNPNLWYHTRT
jgi:hypothetical protein